MIRAALCCVLLAACSSRPTCAPSSCSGCCDESAECRPGTARSACGVDGMACTACPEVQVCRAGRCVAAPDAGPIVVDAGMDAGVPDAGDTDAGEAAPVCSSTRTIAVFDGPIVAAAYDKAFPDAYATMAVATDAGFEQLTADAFFGVAGSNVPGVNALDGGSYRSCGACVTFYERCPAAGMTTTCPRKYFATSGSVDFQQVTKGRPGTMFAQLTDVTLIEWNFTADRAAADAGCVLIRSATFDAGWQ